MATKVAQSTVVSGKPWYLTRDDFFNRVKSRVDLMIYCCEKGNIPTVRLKSALGNFVRVFREVERGEREPTDIMFRLARGSLHNCIRVYLEDGGASHKLYLFVCLKAATIQW